MQWMLLIVSLMDAERSCGAACVYEHHKAAESLEPGGDSAVGRLLKYFRLLERHAERSKTMCNLKEFIEVFGKELPLQTALDSTYRAGRGSCRL